MDAVLASIAPDAAPVLSAGTLLVLALVAFATAVFSAIVGMGGGIVLLAVLLFFLDPLVVIPLHGVIQLVSNGSRAVAQRRHLHWSLIWRYSILLLPFGAVALALVSSVPEDAIKVLIGCFVLLATWRPQWLLVGARPEAINQNRRFILLGAVAGFLNLLVGAVGPFIAPFFLNMDLSRQAIVGTKAACQGVGHLVKIILFGLAGFAFAAFLPLLALLIPMVLLGTWVGTRLLERVNERVFVALFKTVLTLVAGWLIVSTWLLAG
ncbi:MAG: hypothetical protein CBC35_10815 [Planctomycetes bacterium TMED75]|nr:hypothetical protein [Planctomycetaceae bacterium]OUU90831.1 MAG: hypothetical protein CBC35_10815 [Planctomycetes bacterium TMED75]